MSRLEDSAMNTGDEGSANRPAWEISGELKSLEAKLAVLRPREDRMDRERLMFLAGQASVQAMNELPKTLLGLKLDHRAWPAAFGAMTTIAATLFVLLITKPAVVEPQPSSTIGVAIADGPAFRGHPSESPIARVDRRGVLSAGDALAGDIEQLLSTKDAMAIDSNAAAGNLPLEDADRTILTPTAWRQVLNGSESAGPPANDSSSLSTFQGVNS